MTAVTAFAPATVSNVACGFDVLGFALEAPGDEVTARFAARREHRCRRDRRDHRGHRGRRRPSAARRREEHGRRGGPGACSIRSASGEASRCGSARAFRSSSGLGGSAASAAAAVVAVDALLGAASPLTTLLACALEGERLGAGSAHADNIAPALCGGFVLVRRTSPPDVLQLPVPPGLTAVVVHPDLEIETARARALLGTDGAVEGRRAAVGQPRRARPRAAHRRLRRHQPLARRHHRRTAPGAARSRAGRHQAGRGGRRRARLQPVGIGTVALCALQGPRRGPARRGRDDGRRRPRDRRRIRRPTSRRSRSGALVSLGKP